MLLALWRLLIGSSDPAARPQEHRTVSELERRVADLEAQLPRWRVEMAALADQAEDILERATRRQKRGEQAQRQAERAVEDEREQGPDLSTEEGRELYRRHLKVAGR